MEIWNVIVLIGRIIYRLVPLPAMVVSWYATILIRGRNRSDVGVIIFENRTIALLSGILVYFIVIVAAKYIYEKHTNRIFNNKGFSGMYLSAGALFIPYLLYLLFVYG